MLSTDFVIRLVNPYVLPVLYVRKPGDDHEHSYNFPDDDPFFSEVSNLIDVVEDIEEDPEAAQILSSYDGQSLSSQSHLMLTTFAFRRCQDIRTHLVHSRSQRTHP